MNELRNHFGSLQSFNVGSRQLALFSAHDTEHNNAVVLKAWLEERLKTGAKKS